MAVDAGTIYSAIRIELDKLKSDLAKSDKAFNDFAKENKKDSNNITSNWTKAFSTLNLKGVASVAAITLAFKKAVTVFAQTEQSLANVRAVTGATESEFRKLENAANEAGETTRFSAGQAADALYNLASAGFDAQQSVDALDGVLLLAGATGSDLASTSATLTAAISQFDLQASDATRISNAFAAAIGNSQANMEKLSSALRQAGPVAGTLGISVEETTASLQALFNAGFQGEQAGTALRSILLDLSNSTSSVSESLIEAGISFDEFNPRTVGLTQSIETLAASGLDLGNIFGKEAAGQVLTLASAATDTENNLRDLEAAITGTNAASEQYAIQNDTLAGTIDRFKSVAEGLGNSIIGALNPALQGLINLGAGILTAFNNIFKTAKANKDLIDTQREVSALTRSLKIDTKELADRYFELADKEFLSTEQKEEQKKIVETLTGLYPGLTQEILNNKTALTDLINVEREQQKIKLEEDIKKIDGQIKELRASAAKLSSAFQNEVKAAFFQQSKTVREAATGTSDWNEQWAVMLKRIEEAKTLEDFNEIAAQAGTNIRDLSGQFLFIQEDIQMFTDLQAEAASALFALEESFPGISSQFEEYVRRQREAAAAAGNGGEKIDEYTRILNDLQSQLSKVEQTDRDLFIKMLEDKGITEEQIKTLLELYDVLNGIDDAYTVIGDDIDELRKKREEEEKARRAELDAILEEEEILRSYQKSLQSEAIELENSQIALENKTEATRRQLELEAKRQEVLANIKRENALYEQQKAVKDALNEAFERENKLREEQERLNQQARDSVDEYNRNASERAEITEEYNKIINDLTDDLKQYVYTEEELREEERLLFEQRLRGIGISEEQIAFALSLYDQKQEAIEQIRQEREEIEKLEQQEKDLAKEREREFKAEKKRRETAAAETQKYYDLREALEESLRESAEENKEAREKAEQDLLNGIAEGINIVTAALKSLDLGSATTEELLENLATTAQQVLSKIPDPVAQIAAAVIGLGVAIAQTIDDIINFEEQFRTTIDKIDNDIERQILRNRKATLDQEYKLELESLRDSRDARIDSYVKTLSEQERLALQSAGYLEETETERIERLRNKAIQENDREQVALLNNALEIAKIEDDIADKKEKAEKKYKEDIAQYNYKNAEFQRDLAVAQANVQLEKALSELPWYASSRQKNEIRSNYDDLISAINATPLPPIPSFQTGGIVLGTGSSDSGRIINVAENGSNELMLNDSAIGRDVMNGFADMIANRINSALSVSGGVIYLDGRVIAENSATYYNKNIVRLK